MIQETSEADERATPVLEMSVERWDAAPAHDEQDAATGIVESGGVLFLPRLAFALNAEEQRFLSPEWADAKSKNISFDPVSGTLGGATGSEANRAALRAMIARFAGSASSLIAALFPSYRTALGAARTSFRPLPVAERENSWRKDDRRLHVDAFPSRPNRGARILRVFNNVNPHGEPRVWRVGEPFESVGSRLLAHLRPPLPGTAPLLAALGVTKGKRSRYDHMMLQLHDRMKSDADYQRTALRTEILFPPGSTWVCFSDQVSHAVVEGQYLLEHTILLPLSAMREPARSPLRILERLAGRTLA